MKKKKIILVLIILFALIMMFASCNRNVCPAYAQTGNMKSLISCYDKCPPHSPLVRLR